MAKEYKPFGSSTAGYGWTGIKPYTFATRMILANKRFSQLREELGVDAIAFSGSSGCAAAFNIASRSKIPLIYVRKAKEVSHGCKVECNHDTLQIKKYLIVDDFVDSGATIDYIVHSIEKHAKSVGAFPAKQVGVLCFDSYIDRDRNISTDENKFRLFTCDKE